MRALHVTFRYGLDTFGGAEFHMRKISEELLKRGVDVDLCTTRTQSLRPMIKSSVLWDNTLKDEEINGVRVFRFGCRNPNKYIAFLLERLVQGRCDHEEDLEEASIRALMEKVYEEKGAVLLGGWNHVERYGGQLKRMSRKAASFIINDQGVDGVFIDFDNLARLGGRVDIEAPGFKKSVDLPGNVGNHTLEVDLPNLSGKTYVTIRLKKTWSHLKDFRTLGIHVTRIAYKRGADMIFADLEDDFKRYLINKGLIVEYLMKKAGARPRIYGDMFDHMRGPDSPDMVRWLKKHAGDYDVIMAQMFPFNTVKYAMAAKKDRPLAVMPLMHVDDEFYHWPHYYDLLKKADRVFAMSDYSRRGFFDRTCGHTTVIGAGIDKGTFVNGSVDGGLFREKYGLGDRKFILTVSRKSFLKRYDILINAMEKLRGDRKDLRLVMIGPEEDGRPIASDKVVYLGKIPETDLVNAYDACDAFAMMSESESFGMVFCEAWSRKKPVIGNMFCGPVASLISEGVDGYLCSDARDTAAKLELLLSDGDLSKRLGSNGYGKVMDHYTWEKVADKVYRCYEDMMENEKGRRGA